MRLINVGSYIIKNFFGDDIPPYAILSHTWGPEEVTLRDMQVEFGGGDEGLDAPNSSLRTRASDKEGFRKIRFACKQAVEDGLEWVWVDTCCIDKTSSAELSEAINSMYRWYNQADICYAYLLDVTLPDFDSSRPTSSQSTSSATPSADISLEKNFSLKRKRHSPNTEVTKTRPRPQQLYEVARSSPLGESIAGSRWLTRGFTLQELLAPNEIKFYNAQWADIGTRNMGLRRTLASATAIDYECLGSGDHERLANYSIATRMSWASRRSCTRTEDVAYCLMGIFDINMPMLYGEGKKAFVRLQEEILKETEDHSLFAWNVTGDSDRAWKPSSCFAESPHDFDYLRNVHIQRPTSSPRGLSAITKLGLTIDLGKATLPGEREPHYLYRVPHALQYFTLDCSIGRGATMRPVKIPLSVSTSASHDASTPSFCRFVIPMTGFLSDVTTEVYPEEQVLKRVYIRKNLSPQDRNMFYDGSIVFQG